jgi:hypothetical protein
MKEKHFLFSLEPFVHLCYSTLVHYTRSDVLLQFVVDVILRTSNGKERHAISIAVVYGDKYVTQRCVYWRRDMNSKFEPLLLLVDVGKRF